MVFLKILTSSLFLLVVIVPVYADVDNVPSQGKKFFYDPITQYFHNIIKEMIKTINSEFEDAEKERDKLKDQIKDLKKDIKDLEKDIKKLKKK